jgi:hypothetical protein
LSGSVQVVTRSYECIVAQIATDVSGNDLSVDAIFGNKVFIRTSLGGRRGTSVSFAVSSSHDEKSMSKSGEEKEKKSRRKL